MVYRPTPHHRQDSTGPSPGLRSDWNNLRQFLPLLWEFRGRVFIALACLILAKLASVGVPLLLKQIVEVMEGRGQEVLLLPVLLVLGYGGLRLTSSLFNELRDAIFSRVRYHTMRRLSGKVLTHLHTLALRYHLERKTGAISRDLERATRSLSSLLNYLAFSIFPTALEFLLVGGILFSNYPWQFAASTFGTVVIYVLFTLAVTEWRIHYRQEMNALDSEANSQAVDSLINYETVKYFGNEALETERYDKTLGLWEGLAVKTQTSMCALNFGQGAIIAGGVTLIMFLATQGVLAGELSLGDLVLVNAFLLQLFIPLNMLGIVYRQIKYAFTDIELVANLLAEEVEIKDPAKAPDLAVSGGEVRFKNVSFAYQSDRPILHAVDFRIPAGKKTAVVGPSGAGKSTLARLLFRFYDVTAGNISIDGQDIREVSQQSLRGAIGIVPQDTVLFNESIHYNIVYARPGASQDEVEQAARLAHIHDFIASLPQGYDTVVGERGLKLSGGEKQRVAIARVILKNPNILIFDEATSSLDSHSEQAIQTALGEVSTNHTTLVIAHRLSTVVDADEILVMEAGRISERGDHRALLAKQGLYARMWALQQEERQQEKLAKIAVEADA